MATDSSAPTPSVPGSDRDAASIGTDPYPLPAGAPPRRSADTRCALWLGVFLTLVYLLTMAGRLPSIDGEAMYETAYQLVTAGRLSVPPRPGATLGRGGRHYTKYGIGQSLAQLPFVFIGHQLAQWTGQPDDRLVRFWASMTNSFITVALVLVWWAFARDLGYRRSVATSGALMLGLASLLWPYARSDFSESLLALGIMLAAWSLHRWSLAGREARWWMLTAGAGAGLALLTKPTAVVLFPTLALYGGWMLLARARRAPSPEWRSLAGDAAAAIALVAIAALALLALNFYRFGSFWDFGYGGEPASGFTTPLLTGISLLLASSGKGLLWFCPVVALGVWGWRGFARQHRAEAILAALVLGSQLVYFGRWWAWHGDWSWGPRYLVVTVPFLMWAWLPIWERVLGRPRSRAAIALVAAGLFSGVAVNLLGVLVEYGAYYSVLAGQLQRGADVAKARTVPAFSPLGGHWWLARASLYDALIDQRNPQDNPFLHAYPWASTHPALVPPHPEYAVRLDLWFAGPPDRTPWLEFTSSLAAWWLLIALIPAGRSLWATVRLTPALSAEGPPISTHVERGSGGEAGAEARSRWTIASVLAIGAAYLATRLFNLTLLPMHSDEGTYITWGLRALHEQAWLASLEDGKQPLLAWLLPATLAFVPDRLLAGRLVSVTAGAVSLALIGYLTARHFGRAAALGAALAYVVAPIALIHDRMALYDSLLAAAALLVLWRALAWGERPDAWRTVLLGLAVAAAVLTKTSALFFVALVPVVIAVWGLAALHRWWMLLNAFALAALIYSVLYASPIIDNIAEGNFSRYALTLDEVASLPWDIWGQNARFLALTAVGYLTWPLLIAVAAGLVGLRDPARRRATLVWAIWAMLPAIAFGLTSRIFYTRYLVFCLVAALPLAGAGLATIGRWLLASPPGPLSTWVERGSPAAGRAGVRRGRGVRRIAATAAVGLALLPAAAWDWALLTDPPSAGWLDDRRYITDRFQYIESNFAGYGLGEIAAHLQAQASQNPVVVLTRAVTGMPRDGISALLDYQPGIERDALPETEAVATHMTRRLGRAYQQAVGGAPVYYALTDTPDGEQERRFRALNPQARQVLAILKPGGRSRFLLFQVPWTPPGDDHWLDPAPQFGEHIRLVGYAPPAQSTYRPGDPLRFMLYWEAMGRPEQSYTVFTHLIGDDPAERYGQQDQLPLGGIRPTQGWRPGERITDPYELRIDASTPPGRYWLIVGFYQFETGQRLPATVEGHQLPSAFYRLRPIQVTAP